MLSFIYLLLWDIMTNIVTNIIVYLSSIWCAVARVSCNIGRLIIYEPVNLAFKISVPRFGEDHRLNPIVLIHGLAASKELWGIVPQLLSDLTRRKTYTYDARNHGDSQWTEDFSMNLLVEDLRYFMNTHYIFKAIIIGHSLGGLTACLFTIKHPDRVEMLIIEDMVFSAEYVKLMGTRALEYIKLWQEAVKSIPLEMDAPEGIVHAFNYLYDKCPFKEYLEEKELIWKCNFPIKRTSTGYDVKHNMDIICKTLDEWTKMDVGYYRGPFKGQTYFMMASSEHYKLNISEPNVRKYFPNSTITHFEGASHNMHLQDPMQFAEKVLEFYCKHSKHPILKLRVLTFRFTP